MALIEDPTQGFVGNFDFLLAEAHWDDGVTTDVTLETSFSSLDPGIATVQDGGLDHAKVSFLSVGQTQAAASLFAPILSPDNPLFCDFLLLLALALLLSDDPPPTVTIGPLTAVGKNLTGDVDVTISPSGTPVTLTLSTTSGTGAAKFTSNNSTSLGVSSSGTVSITGVTESSTANNIRLSATFNNNTLATRDSTVLLVALSFRPSGQVSLDNSARNDYIGRFGTAALGTFNSSSDEWVTGVEVVGTLTPSNFSQPVMLRRLVTARFYLDQTQTGSADGEEISDLRDDDPQSGGSAGKVYDLDGPLAAPLVSDPIGTIIRLRANFTQWATLDGVRVSSDLHWFSRISARRTVSGNVLDTSVPGDNVAAVGATNLTWNLQ